MSVWDIPGNLDKLKQLQTEGLSASEIGEKFGVTRNAVLGKFHRMGLSKDRTIRKTKQSRSMKKVKSKLKVKEEKVEKITPPELKPVPFAEVTGCMWPYGDKFPYTYCNADTLDKRIFYCPYHINIAVAIYKKSPRSVSVRRTNW